MDVSPEYVKMCEKAEEIQNSGYSPVGSFTLRPLPEHIKVLTIWQHQYSGQYNHYDLALDQGGHYWLIPPIIAPCIWLPRQDQLQEMVKVITIEDLRFCGLLVGWDDGSVDHTTNLKDTSSLEQLWLSFVMKERWDKIWDGENWVVGL